MKQVEFDIELVKKIQSGEIKGCIKTRNGMNARFLGEFNTETCPFVFAITKNGKEFIQTNSKDGRYYTGRSISDIIIEIEEPKQEPKQECQFNPFDKVLGRDEDNQLWKPDIFSYYKEDELYRYRCLGDIFKQCIPYEGNEHLVGTTDKPK